MTTGAGGEARHAALGVQHSDFGQTAWRGNKGMSTGQGRIIVTLVTVLVFGAVLVAGVRAGSTGEHPSIAAGVPFFYYQDLASAADWYEHKLGLEKTTDEGWVVIFRLTPTSYIGLVNATDGTLRPAAEKGAMLSIETRELEAWYRRLKETQGVEMVSGIEDGAKGMIDKFIVRDPGGYLIEFFRWKVDPGRSPGQAAR